MARIRLNGSQEISTGTIPWDAMATGAIVPVESLVNSALTGQVVLGNASKIGKWTTLGGDVFSVSATGSVSIRSINGKLVSLGGSFTTTGAYNLSLALTGATALILPTAGTVTALGNASTGSGSIVLASAPTITAANITLAANPSSALDAATKQYVDSTTTFASVMTAWFNSLPTTLPGTTGQFWNNSGVLSQS